MENIDSASKRLTKIKELCDNGCMIYFGKIVASEISRLCDQKSKLEINSITDNDNNWTPDFSDMLDDFSMEKILKEELANSGLNRASRRKLKKSFYTNKGKAKPALKQRMKESEDQRIIESMKNYPITRNEAKKIMGYFYGESEKSEVIHIFMNSISDLNRLCIWYKSKWNETSKLSIWLRKTGSDLKKSLERSSNEIEKLFVISKNPLHGEGKFLDVRDKLFSKLLVSVPSDYINRLAASIGIKCDRDKINNRNLWTSTPSVQTVTTLAVHVGKRTAMHPGSNRKAKVSDFGDLMHAYYLPHVDIYRTDGFMASVIQGANLPFNTTVVSNLFDLPIAIERKLNERVLGQPGTDHS